MFGVVEAPPVLRKSNMPPRHSCKEIRGARREDLHLAWGNRELSAVRWPLVLREVTLVRLCRLFGLPIEPRWNRFSRIQVRISSYHNMQVRHIETIEQLEQLAEAWPCIARGVPFRSLAWLASWWRHYGQSRELYTLAVYSEEDLLVGLAPWYLQRDPTGGRVLRFLGSGEVCTDYLSLLSTPEFESKVASATADWLIDAANGSKKYCWDLLELDGVSSSDRAVDRLVKQLAKKGASVHRSNGVNCWRIELPSSWEEYLGLLSKSHRKQVRRVERRLLENDRAVLHTADDPQQLSRAMQILTDLHMQRRQSLGENGCFSSKNFSGFLNEAATQLLEQGRLQLHWLELDGTPAAAEFHLRGGGVTYAYQAGVDPQRLDEEPGRMINIATLQKAIADGQQGFDFLRGDEPYKAHWRAQPCGSVTWRVAPRRVTAQIRHGAWRAGRAVKNWLKNSLSQAGM